MKISLLLVDDHPLVRFALRSKLPQHEYEIVGEATDGLEAQILTRELQPEIIVLDLGLPFLDGMALIPRLQEISPRTKILVFTGTSMLANRCIQHGVAGFVSKREAIDGVLLALKAISSGYSHFPMDAFSSAIIENSSGDQQLISTLTNRELAVLKYLSQGLSNKEIAPLMLLSRKTISAYKTRIMQKLNAISVLDLLDFAKRYGLD